MINSPRHRFLRIAALMLAATLLASACGSSDSTDTEAAAEPADADVDAVAADGSIAAGINAAQWADNVTIEYGGDSFTFSSDGLPNHDLPEEFLVPNADATLPLDVSELSVTATVDLVKESPVEVEITLNPVYREDMTQTSLGPIGVMISGALLFNDYEDPDRSLVALDEELTIDGVNFVDDCNGHPLPDGGTYHYHGVPHCITETVDVAGEHSAIIGVLLDGFTIYGAQDVDGSELISDDLDECSGHDGPTPEFPDGIYHYHLTNDRAPYSIDCYHGEIDAGSTGGAGGAGQDAGAAEGGGDLSEAAETLGVSVDELKAALGTPPPDFDAAAATLGVSVADLQAALPAPPDGGAPPQQGDDAAMGDADTGSEQLDVDAE